MTTPDERPLSDLDLAGLDPYDLMDVEAARLDQWLSQRAGAQWQASTACADWPVRDLLAHLAASEEYNRACLDGAVGPFLEQYGARGAADVNAFNALGVADRRERTPDELLAEWRPANEQVRHDLRARDGGDLATSVGPYPIRWQAFHLASELATHADDLGVPIETGESASRQEWRLRFARFALAESRPDVVVQPVAGGTRVQLGEAEASLDDEALIAAVNGRLPDDQPLDPALRAGLVALA